MVEKISKSETEWAEELTQEQYEVCRAKGTERPFSGKYNDCKDHGVYVCSCCGHPLFGSSAKYDSRSGWPSFFTPVDGDAVTTEVDVGLMMQRTEVLCARCDAHLGHVFDDGPQPTGLRYCMNSVSLKLEPEGGD
jgi:peptide-methionine (R)-S-oxide reductase